MELQCENQYVKMDMACIKVIDKFSVGPAFGFNYNL